jgi:hypothetical protein
MSHCLCPSFVYIICLSPISVSALLLSLFSASFLYISVSLLFSHLLYILCLSSISLSLLLFCIFSASLRSPCICSFTVCVLCLFYFSVSGLLSEFSMPLWYLSLISYLYSLSFFYISLPHCLCLTLCFSLSLPLYYLSSLLFASLYFLPFFYPCLCSYPVYFDPAFLKYEDA